MTEQIKAGVYVRCSTPKQKDSIADQKRAITEYAKKHGITITAWYADEGKSGTSFKKRPAFMRMAHSSFLVMLISQRFLFTILIVGVGQLIQTNHHIGNTFSGNMVLMLHLLAMSL